MNPLITVQPRPEQRRPFARWAVAQVPKVRTVGPSSFGVPPHLYTDMPEALLRGALVDGHPYRSPADYEATEPAPAGAPELLGVATPDGLRDAVLVPPLPEAPATFEEGELKALHDAGDNTGDTEDGEGDSQGDTAEAAPAVEAVNSRDTSGDTGDASGDTEAGDPAKPYVCGDGCPRSFTTARGRARHRRTAHGR
ncbi:hypothetical protein ACQRET_03335 [Streptomyces koyangensis]|uniref:hypothetical protein n=1 Tax=Streptomyces koyangensis TaxID=188770 RepID=UPI003D001ECB